MIILITLITISIGNMDIDRRKLMLVNVGIVTQQEPLLVPDDGTGLGRSPYEGDKFRTENV